MKSQKNWVEFIIEVPFISKEFVYRLICPDDRDLRISLVGTLVSAINNIPVMEKVRKIHTHGAVIKGRVYYSLVDIFRLQKIRSWSLLINDPFLLLSNKEKKAIEDRFMADAAKSIPLFSFEGVDNGVILETDKNIVVLIARVCAEKGIVREGKEYTILEFPIFLKEANYRYGSGELTDGLYSVAYMRFFQNNTAVIPQSFSGDGITYYFPGVFSLGDFMKETGSSDCVFEIVCTDDSISSQWISLVENRIIETANRMAISTGFSFKKKA